MMEHWFRYPNIDPVAFHLGPIPIHWYGISYLIGFVCVYLWMNRPNGRARLGLTSDQIQDFLVYALVGVLVGGRALFVIADMISKHNASDYFSHPINFIAVWTGGMAFHGALVGVILATLLFLRKHRGLSFNRLGDEVVVLLPIGIALTRLVNFINDELWGRLCRPDHPYCILFPNHADGYRYPSQIFEAILDILTLPIVLLIYRARPPDGVVAWSWFALYGITRSIAEIWREPDIVVGGITGGQMLALPMIVIGIIMVTIAYRKSLGTARAA
ncbi:MAG: prolipoprotein diacylglyceryl transferase [Candidatus Eremiobacteraeota bacterium]|nr:prolipoprotein diacylglyceryl transferase [Candidatus Eremiobacteraeota bacterium]